MAIDFLTPLGIYVLGVVLFIILCIGVVVVLRAMIRQQQYLAKWDFLHAAEDANKHEQLLRCHDERIQIAKHQTQRGDAP